MHLILILIIVQHCYGLLGWVFSFSDWSGLRGYRRGNSRHRVDSISSDSASFQSILPPRAHRIYPSIINVDCYVVYMHHIPWNPPGAARIVLSLSGAPPPARHALEDSIIATKYALGPAPRPQYFIYVSPTERGRE